MHAVSLTLWGEPRGSAAWLREGLPASLFDSLARVDDLAAYLQVGALVQYLLSRHGVEPLARVWRRGVSEFPHA